MRHSAPGRAALKSDASAATPPVPGELD